MPDTRHLQTLIQNHTLSFMENILQTNIHITMKSGLQMITKILSLGFNFRSVLEFFDIEFGH